MRLIGSRSASVPKVRDHRVQLVALDTQEFRHGYQKQHRLGRAEHRGRYLTPRAVSRMTKALASNA